MADRFHKLGKTAGRRHVVVGLASVALAASMGATAGTVGPPMAEVRLAGTTIGVGGSFDGTSSAIPQQLYGTAVAPGDTYLPVVYPAALGINIPILSDLPGLSSLPGWPQTLSQSAARGVDALVRAVNTVPAGEKVTVVGLSQGAIVVQDARQRLAADPRFVQHPENLQFLMLGNPYTPNGGILARFSFLKDVPIVNGLIPFGRVGPSDSPSAATYVVNQYDGLSDFPKYFNPLAILNALVGTVVQHADPGYVQDSVTQVNTVKTTVGNNTYVTIPKLLPILAPFHTLASLVGAQRFVDFLDPVLRVIVETAYDRTADPSKIAPFSLFTPAEKIQQALAQLPAAIAQSIAILRGEPYNPSVEAPVVTPSAPTTSAVSSTPVAAPALKATAVDPTLKADTVQAETLKADTVKVETLQAETLKAETAETPTSKAPALDASRVATADAADSVAITSTPGTEPTQIPTQTQTQTQTQTHDTEPVATAAPSASAVESKPTPAEPAKNDTEPATPKKVDPKTPGTKADSLVRDSAGTGPARHSTSPKPAETTAAETNSADKAPAKPESTDAGASSNPSSSTHSAA